MKTTMSKPTFFDLLGSDRQRGVWDRNEAFRPAPAEKATEAPPGSREKVRTMIERIHSGEELWHPLDRDDGRYE